MLKIINKFRYLKPTLRKTIYTFHLKRRGKIEGKEFEMEWSVESMTAA